MPIWESLHQFSSVQSFSRVRLFVTPWTAARQASPFITNSCSPPKPMSIESVMPSKHHWLNGHGFGWTTGVGDEWGGLACCGSWGHKESSTTEWLNWTELMEAFSYRHGWSFISFLAPLSCLENRWGWKVQASNHGLVFLVTSPARGPPRVASLKATGYTVVTQEIPKDLSTLC